MVVLDQAPVGLIRALVRRQLSPRMNSPMKTTHLIGGFSQVARHEMVKSPESLCLLAAFDASDHTFFDGEANRLTQYAPRPGHGQWRGSGAGGRDRRCRGCRSGFFVLRQVRSSLGPPSLCNTGRRNRRARCREPASLTGRAHLRNSFECLPILARCATTEASIARTHRFVRWRPRQNPFTLARS